MKEKVEHSISFGTLATIIGLIVGGILVLKLANLILLVLVALMLAAALDPLVKKLSKKLPVALSATVVVVGILLPVAVVIAAGIPPIIAETPGILLRINDVIRNAPLIPDSIRSSIDLAHYAPAGGQYLIHSASVIASVITKALSLVFLTIYLLVDRDNLKKLLKLAVPKQHKQKALEIVRVFANICGQYIRGNLIISLVCSVFIFIGLLILHVPNAPLLAVFAGILDLLPLVGAFIGAVPAVVLAFVVSPTVGLFTVALFVVYQQLENYILAPRIYNKALNLSPAGSFLAVLAGATLYGVTGAFLALPLAASIPAVLEYIQEYENRDE